MINKEYKKNFEVLETVSKRKDLNKKTEVMVIFHLLDTSFEFLRILNDSFTIKTIIGIPYSINKDTVQKLQEITNDTCNIIVPTSIKEITNIALQEIKNYSKKERIIILEVGGYCAKISNELKKIRPNIMGIVEDTNQGHWEYEQLPSLPFPVYSIAQSPIKQLENRLIGKAVTFSLENMIRKNFYMTCAGKAIGVLGYGKIGKSVAQSSKGREGIVYVWDIDPIKRIEARLDGYVVIDRQAMFQRCDIIIGVSGKQSIQKDDFKYIKNKSILASGSSKRVEFDIEYLENQSISKYQRSIKEKVAKYKNGNQEFYILNEGMPINFDDNSVLDTTLDLIFSELYMCLIQLLNEKIFTGIHQLSINDHNYICNIWEEKYTK